MTIDPLTLLLSLDFVIERKPETLMNKYFEYDLTPYPISLFKNGLMRLSLSKSLLKDHVLKPCAPCDCPEGEALVDGGSLM